MTDVGTFLAVPLHAPEGAAFVFDAPAVAVYTIAAVPASLLD